MIAWDLGSQNLHFYLLHWDDGGKMRKKHKVYHLHKILNVLLLLALLFSTTSGGFALPALASPLIKNQSTKVDQNLPVISISVTNEMIASEAESRVGQYGDQCKIFVQQVLASLGITLGVNYRQAYLDAGFYE